MDVQYRLSLLYCCFHVHMLSSASTTSFFEIKHLREVLTKANTFVKGGGLNMI